MALKDLLVYVDQTENSLVRLRLAVDLAIRNDSRLTAIFVKEWNRDQLDLRKAAELGLVSAEGLNSLDRRIETSIEAAAERLRSTLETLTREHGVVAELRCVDGVASVVRSPARALCRSLHPGPGPAGGPCFRQLHLRRAPAVRDRTAGVVRPSSRITRDAWPPYCRGLELEPARGAIGQRRRAADRARRADNGPHDQSIGLLRPHDGLPGEHIVEHLRRHGASADAVRIDDVPPDSIADRLQAEAHALGADLIVAGAFGHPRLWEKLLGGVTYDLLARMSLPIFMSH